MRYSKNWVLAGCVFALSTAAGGCKSGNNAPDPIPLNQFPQTFAKTLCDTVAPCCAAAALPYSATECQGNATDTFTRFATSASSSRVQYDPDAAGLCLSALRDSLSTCTYGSASLDACRAIFRGTVPGGGACVDSSECVSQFCNNGFCAAPRDTSIHGQVTQACIGECYTLPGGTPECSTILVPPAGNGVPATAYCYESDGLFCDFNGQTGVCAAYARLGESCVNGPCGPGTFCDFQNVGMAVCAAQRESGPCQTADTCNATSYCAGSNTGQGQCVARKPDGFACTSDNECASDSCRSSSGSADHRTCGRGGSVTAGQCEGDF
jgi:hypothetical protein